MPYINHLCEYYTLYGAITVIPQVIIVIITASGVHIMTTTIISAITAMGLELTKPN